LSRGEEAASFGAAEGKGRPLIEEEKTSQLSRRARLCGKGGQKKNAGLIRREGGQQTTKAYTGAFSYGQGGGSSL